MNHLVVTVVAPDKPGQVERIAHCIAEHGGNWLESRMSRLAGQFAGILRLSVPIEQRDALVTALHELATHDIRVLLAEESEEPTLAWTPIHMALVGTDRPGIVRDITRLLAGQGVNVERLVTEVMTAPMSGEWLFRAEAVLGVPATVTLDDLQARLETLADDLMVELELREDPAA
ncbi:glycine cleavage system protein R [Pseudomonas sp. Leaf127]|uniref:glycine cleavage system protein R n=1 Tax=Pseudomonas sp. Leaf127 TaxID=1736267 RepID=UPI0007039AE5|nr:ACT domain-containing protein [Pseudomonas sp. Leaf127]KQQ54188.1 glycine cleavage system protein R [Pseudomonas sp. Leaf127]